jgi:major membrane immunogen (membrane-anchored lipoprotein)
MNKFNIPLLTFLLLGIAFSTTVSKSQNRILAENNLQDTTNRYKDGIYEGKSRSKYTAEPYWGSVRLTIKNGIYTGVVFAIRDSNLHETFDGKYEKHFEGNSYYIQQSRNDWKGVQSYPDKLMKQQDINKLDAISGATWSYNIFRASVNEALKKAR